MDSITGWILQQFSWMLLWINKYCDKWLLLCHFRFDQLLFSLTYCRRYLFQMQPRQTFFKFLWKLKGRDFTFKIFQILNLLLGCCLLRVLGIAINAYMWIWKISANEKVLWQSLLKIERVAILWSMNTETSNF